MARLRIGIKRIENIVFGKVLEQTGVPRVRYYPHARLVAEGGRICRAILSRERPRLRSGALYIGGINNKEDSDWFAYAYDDGEEAALVVEDIKMLVAKVNGIEATPSDTSCGLDIVE